MDYFKQGCEFYNQQDYESAIYDFKLSLKQNKDNYIYRTSLYNLGMCYLQLEDYKESEKWIRKIKNKGNKEHYAIGYCLVGQEDYGGALFNFLLASQYDEQDEHTINAIEQCIKIISELERLNE